MRTRQFRWRLVEPGVLELTSSVPFQDSYDTHMIAVDDERWDPPDLSDLHWPELTQSLVRFVYDPLVRTITVQHQRIIVRFLPLEPVADNVLLHIKAAIMCEVYYPWRIREYRQPWWERFLDFMAEDRGLSSLVGW